MYNLLYLRIPNKTKPVTLFIPKVKVRRSLRPHTYRTSAPMTSHPSPDSNEVRLQTIITSAFLIARLAKEAKSLLPTVDKYETSP